MATPLSGVFATPDPRPSRAQGIAAALSGFGAGVQGRGPEYVMAMQEQQKALSQERQQAMIQDALAVNNLLSQNNVEGAMNLMNRRVNLINQLGGDPSDTLEVMELVQTGRVPEAQQLIGGFLGQAQAMGLYQPPQAQQIKAGDITESGQALFATPEGQVVARDVQGFRAPEPKPETELARKFVQQVMPDGTFRTLQTDQRGNFFDTAGNAVQLPAGANLVEGTVMQGKPEDFNTTSAEFRQLRDRESATRATIATIGDMLGMLQENPNINTFVSNAAGFVNNLSAEVKALANAMGAREEVDALINPDRFSSEFNELGIRNRQMQSLINGLAYAVARSNDPSGTRVSDADVRNAIREIGGSSSDPVAFSRVLTDVARRADRNYRIDYRTRTGGNYQDDLGIEAISGIQIRDIDQSGPPTINTQEEYDALPSGAIYIDNGQQYRKP